MRSRKPASLTALTASSREPVRASLLLGAPEHRSYCTPEQRPRNRELLARGSIRTVRIQSLLRLSSTARRTRSKHPVRNSGRIGCDTR